MSSKAKVTKRAQSPSMGEKKPPGNDAKKQMCSIFSSPAPPPIRHVRNNRSGGDAASTALCKVQGIVTRTKDEVVQGPKGPIPKRRVDIIVTNVISNGAQDIVRTGVEGEIYLFPSKKVDTPETAETANDQFKGSARELVVSAMQPVRKLSTFSSSFYKDTKDGSESPVCLCDVGMTVEITGVHVNEVMRNGVAAYYLNAGKLACNMDKAPSKGILARHMIGLASQEKMQAWSAFAGSVSMKGFFNDDFMNAMPDVQKTQALACQSMWARMVEGAADRLAVMQQGKDEETAAVLKGHEDRVRASPASKIAAGDLNLFLIDRYDSTIMPVVQKGMAPWDNVPEIIKKLQGAPEQQATLPNAFTAPWVHPEGVTIQGKAVNIDMRIAFVFDRATAIEAFDRGDASPLLVTSSAGASMTLSMRDMAAKFGTLLQPKVQMACEVMLRTGDFAAFIKMANVEDGSESLVSDFPEGGTVYLDMSTTLQTHSIVVSEGFIKANMCGGGTQYVPAKVAATVEKLEFPVGVADMPDLEEFGYQELTYDAFDIENWSSLGEVEYRIVHPGIYAMLQGDDEKGTGEVYTTDPAKGEAFIKGLQPDLDQPRNMKKYLTESCLVYARLV